MPEGQKKTGWRRCLHAPKSSISIYVGALLVLAMGAAAEAGASPNGLTVETGGMKISLQLFSPDGAKVTFQRAEYLRP